MVDSFSQRKKDVLAKLDKSFKQSWDEKIVSLCEKINLNENYYTTSSCSGRIVLIIDKVKKETGLFVKVFHDLINLNDLKENLNSCSEKFVKFKQEYCFAIVVCKNLEDALDLIGVAKNAGLKKCDIQSISDKGCVVELMSSEKLEFPIIENGEILVNDSFLEVIVEKANKNLQKGWIKLDKFLKLLDNYISLKSSKSI